MFPFGNIYTLCTVECMMLNLLPIEKWSLHICIYIYICMSKRQIIMIISNLNKMGVHEIRMTTSDRTMLHRLLQGELYIILFSIIYPTGQLTFFLSGCVSFGVENLPVLNVEDSDLY